MENTTDTTPEKLSWQDTALAKFRPLPKHLNDMSEKAKGFTLDDFKDAEKSKVAHDHRIALRDARVELQKIGKSLRADALTFQKTVISKEKELVAIVEPEEKRLKDLEEEAKRIEERKKREELIPKRKQRIIELVPEGVENPYLKGDDELLDMDSQAFESFFNDCRSDWNAREADRIRREAQIQQEEREKKLQAEQAEIQRKREELEDLERKAKAQREVEEARLAQERARLDAEVEARKQAEQEAKLKAEREKAEAEAELARLETEKKEEEERLAKKEEWQAFISEHGYTEENKDDFIFRGYTEENTEKIIMFKKVGEFIKK